jgi:hypothetical protein
MDQIWYYKRKEKMRLTVMIHLNTVAVKTFDP